ncbi:uncharacterized protein LOC111076293 isoform X2 [Drosophila obscura]|uniref:uncharacterized protein LOC111076293 isoform X2 n=1 Tax=Drosophila obscura TaxID=7282 RepID=UPI001BB2962D|nr:uncharacterized protein LOC111076293 isoform X2 [Drosophila obscura]
MAHVGGVNGVFAAAALRDIGEKPAASVASSTALAIRNSTIIAHRLSIYLPQLLLPSRDPQKLITEINCSVAQFREMLIFIGQARDSPELREKIRKLRRSCLDACRHTAHLITPQPRHCLGSPSERMHLTLLYHLTQLFHHELIKSHRLIQLVPLDMTDAFAYCALQSGQCHQSDFVVQANQSRLSAGGTLQHCQGLTGVERAVGRAASSNATARGHARCGIRSNKEIWH